jgi:hypothetical protein
MKMRTLFPMLLCGLLLAQQPVPPTLPTTEMLRLSKLYVGTWDYTEKYPKRDGSEGPRNTGVYTSELGPGGNSIINHFHSHGPVGDFDGMLVMTWDATDKVYKQYVFGSDFPGAVLEKGTWEGDTLEFRGDVPTMNLQMRTSSKLLPDGTLVSDAYMSRPGGKERLLAHVESHRRK